MSLLIIILSVPLQLLPFFNQFLIIFKPRTVSLSDSGLAFSFRGLSGLMPEPSFVGTCLAILLLSLFLISFFDYLFSYFFIPSNCSINIPAPHLTLVFVIMLISISSFISSNLFSLLVLSFLFSFPLVPLRCCPSFLLPQFFFFYIFFFQELFSKSSFYIVSYRSLFSFSFYLLTLFSHSLV